MTSSKSFLISTIKCRDLGLWGSRSRSAPRRSLKHLTVVSGRKPLDLKESVVLLDPVRRGPDSNEGPTFWGSTVYVLLFLTLIGRVGSYRQSFSILTLGHSLVCKDTYTSLIEVSKWHCSRL